MLSWTQGMPPSTHLNAYCLLNPERHGMIGAGPKNLIIQMVTQHMITEHPETNVYIQGEAFEVVDAPERCDLCNTVLEPPCWIRTVKPNVIPGDADGRWGVCDPCEADLQAGNIESIVTRHWGITAMTSPDAGDNKQLQRMMRRVVWQNAAYIATGSVEREEVGDGPRG